MIFPKNSAVGRVQLSPRGPFVTGERVTLALTFTVGRAGLQKGARLRIGLPNTGWERPVAPQARYWDELVQGKSRGYAPFHPANTTAQAKTNGKGLISLECMERMLLPDEDPAEAYWRWWITATVEDAPLAAGDKVLISYGDPRFTGEKARIQTFPENDLTIAAYIDVGDGRWIRPAGSPIVIDVLSGPPLRANVVAPSVVESDSPRVRIALTDTCHCRPTDKIDETLVLRDARGRKIAKAKFSKSGIATVELPKTAKLFEPLTVTDATGQKIWGHTNPSVLKNGGDRKLFWGDLHAQSEYHVMHSQKKDARQKEWSKGISCGSPDDVYQYARDVSLLDFVAITDQGAITGVGWDLLQEKAAQYNQPGQFVTFNSYEAGSPVGHRNVFYRNCESDPRQDAKKFNYMPEFLYRYYAGRKDVMMIPHHVKTWTDWSYFNPELEPVMEIYSCWGQSENASMERWDKGMTPGAGAWEALKRGYRLGMIASSDNHVGMPGRSYPHDRQVHTPFPGGLAAVWAPALTREAIFDAIRERRCYGTTGARMILEFKVNGAPMGGEVKLQGKSMPRKICTYIRGTDAIRGVEIISNGNVIHTAMPDPRKAEDTFTVEWTDKSPLPKSMFYYVRVMQADGEMAWCSPVWVDPA